MLIYLKIAVVLIAYFILFFSFGSMVTCRFRKDSFSYSLTLIIGFFLYYLSFQIVCIPTMFLQCSLSSLSIVWVVVSIIVIAVSIRTNYGIWVKAAGCFFPVIFNNSRTAKGKAGLWDVFWDLVPVAVALINIVLVSVIYSNYWDATYYVGTVSYSVYHNVINTYNPLTGELFSALDLRHCLATYNMQDAVICQLFDIHPLIECKTVMVIVVSVILNLLYYAFGTFLFHGEARPRALFMGFCFLINVCTYTACTSSSFILLRTYEGKAITAAVTTVFLLYWLLRLFNETSDEENKLCWTGLFITSWGGVAISTSAMFLDLAALGAFTVVMLISRHKISAVLGGVKCMIPAGMMLTAYILYSMGMLSVSITAID